MIQLVINGQPQALKRHRTYQNKVGNKFITRRVDPSEDDKEIMLWKCIAANKPDKPIEGPISLIVTFYMRRPKNHYGTGKNAGILKESAPRPVSIRPDLDNLIKFVCDALNGVYFKDDSQIFNLSAKKLYTDGTPRTEIVIMNEE